MMGLTEPRSARHWSRGALSGALVRAVPPSLTLGFLQPAASRPVWPVPRSRRQSEAFCVSNQDRRFRQRRCEPPRRAHANASGSLMGIAEAGVVGMKATPFRAIWGLILV